MDSQLDSAVKNLVKLLLMKLGCLTTVSTFVVELTKLKELKDAYLYGIASVAATQILLLLSCGIFLFVKYE